MKLSQVCPQNADENLRRNIYQHKVIKCAPSFKTVVVYEVKGALRVHGRLFQTSVLQMKRIFAHTSICLMTNKKFAISNDTKGMWSMQWYQLLIFKWRERKTSYSTRTILASKGGLIELRLTDLLCDARVFHSIHSYLNIKKVKGKTTASCKWTVANVHFFFTLVLNACTHILQERRSSHETREHVFWHN